jgi:hypothetical protein
MQNVIAILPFALLAANTMLMLALFFGINQRVRRFRKRVDLSLQTETANTANTLRQLSERIGTIEKGEVERTRFEVGAPALNSTLRAKILKMHRLGQSPDRIAEALRIPRGDIELLVKVHGIIMRTYETAPGPVLEGEVVKKD